MVFFPTFFFLQSHSIPICHRRTHTRTHSGGRLSASADTLSHAANSSHSVTQKSYFLSSSRPRTTDPVYVYSYSRADSNFCCVYFFLPLILLLLSCVPLTHPTTYCIDRLLDASLAAFASLADAATRVYPRRRRKYWKNLFPAGERMC